MPPRSATTVPPPLPDALPGRGPGVALDRVVGVLTAVAAPAYSLFLLTPLLGPTLDPARSYVSELAALDQARGGLFRAVDAAVGVVVLLAGLRLVHGGGHRAVRAGGTALGLFGLGTLLDVAAPMACAPSADAVCAAAERDRTVLEFGVHEVVGVATNLVAVLAVVALLAASTRRRSASQRAAPVECALLLGLPLVAVPGLVVVLQETVGLGLAGVIGLVQRVQVLALSAVLMTVGLVLCRGPSRAWGGG